MLLADNNKSDLLSPCSLSGAFFYGAGGRGCALADCFVKMGLKAKGFVVTDLEKNWKNEKRELLGLEVISIDDFAERFADAPLIITAKYEDEMLAKCNSLGLKNVRRFYEALLILGVSLSYDRLEREEVEGNPQALAALDAWADNESREKYRSLVNLHFRPDMRYVPPCEPDQYFSGKYLPAEFFRDVVDGGAYDGDTLAEFVKIAKGGFESYYAFEPDPVNFWSLSESSLVMDSRVRIYRAGLSDKAGMMRMQSFGGLGSFMSDGGNVETATVVLSDVIAKDAGVTLIKMDIEGHEEHALAGAEKLIRRRRPALAIAVYHRIEHLWRIPLWIKNLNLGYVLRLGHHSRDHDESICYAVPE